MLSQVETISDFCKQLQKAIGVFEITGKCIDDLIKVVIKKNNDHTGSFCLYFDNFESIWNSQLEQVRGPLVNFLKVMQSNQVRVVISSRVDKAGLKTTSKRLRQLDRTSAEKLFLHIYEPKAVKKRKKIFLEL